MVDDTWDNRAVPILEHVATLEATGAPFNLPHVAETLGCSRSEVQIEVDRLRSGGYLGGDLVQKGDGAGGIVVWDFRRPRLLEKGSRAVGQWPSDDPYDALLSLIEQRLDDETDPETRTKLERLRATLLDVGKGVAGGILGSLIRAGLGLP
jgi:hypothetical protein